MLTKTEKKILYELDKNSRQSYKLIAKKLGISRQLVEYHIKKLQKIGIIKRFYAAINTGQLGLHYTRIYLKLSPYPKELENKLIDYFREKKEIYWYVKYLGYWTFAVAVFYNKTTTINKIFNELLEMAQDYIVKYDTAKGVKRHILKYNSIHDAKDRSYITLEWEEGFFDEIDMNIIDIIRNDARIPSLKIAERLNLNVKTIITRLKRLEKIGVIKQYTVVLRIKELNLQMYQIQVYFKNNNISIKNNFIKELLIQDNIRYVGEFIGDQSLHFELISYNRYDLQKSLDILSTKFPNLIKFFDVNLVYEGEPT